MVKGLTLVKNEDINEMNELLVLKLFICHNG